MAEENFEEKTEQPTPRRREEHRKKGEVAKSRELPSVGVLLAGMVTLSLLGPHMYANIQVIINESLSLPAIDILQHHNQFLVFGKRLITLFLLIVSPIMAVIFFTAILSNVLQVGFMLSGESIKPKLSKLDPVKGFGRLFSKQSFMELFKSIMKLVIVGSVAYFAVRGEMDTVPDLGRLALKSIFTYIFITIIKISIKCTLAMILIVVIDYAFQRWSFEKRLKMSKQEVKDEFKKTEGDPLIKARIKSIQAEMARKRMMQAVPQADVVITNPTHLAIAIKYDSLKMDAPKVLAKGAGVIAQKIKALAEKHHIPIIENKALAQNLYSAVEIGQEIPPNLYHSVAEVLAYVYKFKQRYAHGVA